jgi:hypothetical protein
VLAYALASIYTVGLVGLFASGRLTSPQAGALLALPIVLGIALLRPEWVALVVVGVPPVLVSSIPPRQVTAIMLVALFGFLIQGNLRVGLGTGVYPVLAIIALALIAKADVSAEAATAADSMLKFLVYYAALMLVAFHAAAQRRIQIETFVNVLLIGIVATTVLQPFVAGSGIGDLSSAFVRTKYSYLAVMGFGVTYLRFSQDRSEGRAPSAVNSWLMVLFFLLSALGFGRAAWMAGLLIFALASMWTGRKSFWVVGSLFLVLVLTVPAVRERVVPGGSIDASDVTLARLTSGRSELWDALYTRGIEALPFGNGWGYTWSLTTTELLGVGGVFGVEGSGYAYPHNDFLFLFMELGILGVSFACHPLDPPRLATQTAVEKPRRTHSSPREDSRPGIRRHATRSAVRQRVRHPIRCREILHRRRPAVRSCPCPAFRTPRDRRLKISRYQLRLRSA